MENIDVDEEKFYVYILKCIDNSLYTGCTNDIVHRYKTHQAGKGGKYTKSHLPVELVYVEEQANKRAALSREFQLKHLSRSNKLELIKSKSNKVEEIKKSYGI